ncbi:MAG: helix-turn-helix domain-containing protein [Bacilli bacterium]|nr:helix-turn-helix domain-containing protein [Bacilli bacterium]
MKEIGEKLKTTRENTGLSIEEVSEDIKIEVNKIEAIEQGIKDIFKDIYELKDYISIYSKYLNLDVEDILKEFDEFVFDYTCKITVGELNNNCVEEKKVISPYTKEVKKQNKKIWLLVLIFILLVGAVVGYIIIKNKDDNNTNFVYLN